LNDLAARQEALVRALVAGGTTPAGFDETRIALTRQSLMRKRARAVAAHWPAIGALPDYQRRFAQWAGNTPPGSAHSEGLAFGQSLGRDISPSARVELVLAGAGRIARDGDCLIVRWPALGIRRLPISLAMRGRAKAR
jgi:hypothetical protein